MGSETARVSFKFDNQDVVAERRPPEAVWKQVTHPSRVPICNSCSRRGQDRPVKINPDGGLTGLCETHGAFEAEMRLALRTAAVNGHLTEAAAKEVRAAVIGRFGGRR